MRVTRYLSCAALVLTGMMAGMWFSERGSRGNGEGRAMGAEPANGGGEVAALRAEVERLKTIATDQSHVMMDVEYHFSNLWFAGMAENWPLAEFYWKETLSHLHWAVRVIPVRKDNQGREIKLADILQAIENGSQSKLGEVIAKKEKVNFASAYRGFLEACYTCHKAADKPYLRPRVPEEPASRIINFNPQADWPR